MRIWSVSLEDDWIGGTRVRDGWAHGWMGGPRVRREDIIAGHGRRSKGGRSPGGGLDTGGPRCVIERRMDTGGPRVYRWAERSEIRRLINGRTEDLKSAKRGWADDGFGFTTPCILFRKVAISEVEIWEGSRAGDAVMRLRGEVDNAVLKPRKRHPLHSF